MSKEKNNLEMLRHSMSHVMAAAIQKLYPEAKFAIGPSIENGYYYDIDFGDKKLTEDDLPKIEKEMKAIIKKGLEFERSEMDVDEAIKKEEKSGQIYKKELIEDLKSAGEKKVSYYKLGDFEDLCRGPHVEKSSKIKPGTYKLISLAGAYWRGDEKNKMLTRIYGVGFESKEALADYQKMMKEAEERNHRKIGREMELFRNFNEIGQGLPVWLPNGYTMRRVLEDYMWKLERSYGYVHILTPHINKKELFETSGHLGFYDKDMYSPMQIDEETFYLKPMNCPAGMMIYKMKPRSYRDLPYKQGEFGTVYRYEKSGELHGLQRVRGFTQNDAHIFCTPDQLKEQFLEVMEMLEKFYSDVGFENYRYRLSLYDDEKDKYVGDRKDWLQAEETMREVLVEKGVEFYEEKGEAAFYGPKLDVQAVNVFGKEDSISTIQVDFNLPERFDVHFIDKDGQKKRPFVIHRALIGSFERFFAFLIEYYGGKFPVWFAPVQVKIVAVSEKHIDFCNKLAREFFDNDVRVEVDISDETVGNKIRKAVKEKVPYMLVVGDKEMGSENLMIRDRGSQDVREISKENFFAEIRNKVVEKK
ncbi:threonine--tRNA ligase [Candidatus Parcubacteria bacterium]|nr:MAG: threonine--tRNA ligase [Candidatus Parcubacteria bacterium]